MGEERDRKAVKAKKSEKKSARRESDAPRPAKHVGEDMRESTTRRSRDAVKDTKLKEHKKKTRRKSSRKDEEGKKKKRRKRSRSSSSETSSSSSSSSDSSSSSSDSSDAESRKRRKKAARKNNKEQSGTIPGVDLASSGVLPPQEIVPVPGPGSSILVVGGHVHHHQQQAPLEEEDANSANNLYAKKEEPPQLIRNQWVRKKGDPEDGSFKGQKKGASKGGKGASKGGGADGAPEKMEQPNFETSGLLAMEDAYEREQQTNPSGKKSNFRNDLESGKLVGQKLGLPLDAVAPAKDVWRIYVFAKTDQGEPKIAYLSGKPGFTFGKDRKVVDIPTDHPSCSKQHAAIHFRRNKSTGEVVPYVIDLESTNGTFLNGERLEGARYYELLPKDKLNFANSTRDYILMSK